MEHINEAIPVCIKNGKRLVEDAEYLQEYERYPSAFSLSVLAQEELEKAFILVLVRDNVLPWTQEIKRSIHNHECKHLVGIIMEWLGPPIEKAIERMKSYLNTWEPEKMPRDVSVAINILRHEKIERFKEGYNFKEKEWDGVARQIAKGLKSRLKHRGFYISLTKDGGLDSFLPNLITNDMLQEEIERAKQYIEFAEDAHRGIVMSKGEYDMAKAIIKAVFEDLSRNEV